MRKGIKCWKKKELDKKKKYDYGNCKRKRKKK